MYIEFDWADVVPEKHKEYYLGQSLKLEPTWIVGDKGSSVADASVAAEEKRRIQQAEEEAMMEAL